MIASMLLGLTALSSSPGPEKAVVSILLTSPAQDSSHVEFVVSAIPASGDKREPVVARGALRDMVRIRLDQGLWKLTVDADGYWSRPREVWVSGDTDLTVPVWPAAVFRGRLGFRPGQGGPLPARLTASPELLGPKDRPGYVTTEACQVERTEWRCLLPAASLNVRVKPEGYVARYFNNVPLSPRTPTDVGLLLLERGASVAGRVVDPQGKAVPGARVELRAASGDPLGSPASATTDRIGFFQLLVPSPATFTVQASDGPRSAASAPFDIREADEFLLSEPLALRVPLRLRVSLNPPSDPDGKPWRIRLVRVDGTEGKLVANDVVVSDQGSWTRSGLGPGTYLVAVSTSSGIRWTSKKFELAPESDLIEVQIDPCSLKGTIRLGGRPVRAHLVLGGHRGPVSIPFDSDEAGEFGGLIPCRDDLFTRQWKVDVEADEFRRTLQNVKVVEGLTGEVRVDLSLADSSLDVLVVDEQGVPVSDPLLTVVNALRPDLMEQALGADPEKPGHSRLVGLDDGSYYVSARAGGGVSDSVRCEITENSRHPTVRLVVRKQLELSGRVVANDGTPVPFATLVPIPIQATLQPVEEVASDAAGSFQIRLPDETRQLALTVRAYGMAYKIVRVNISPDQPLKAAYHKVGAQRRSSDIALRSTVDLKVHRVRVPRGLLRGRGQPSEVGCPARSGTASGRGDHPADGGRQVPRVSRARL